LARTTIRAEQVNEDTLQDADNDTKVMVEESSDGDKIRFDTAGTERMIILNDGAVGIGITAPANPLSVYADVSSTYVALIDNDQSSAGHGLKVTSDGTGSGTYLFDIESASTTLFRVRGDGRVGLGKVTSLPAAMLTVSSSNTDGDIAIAHKIQHIGDDDTFISFDDDLILLKAGDKSFIRMAENGAASNMIFNNGSNNIDMQFKGDNDDNLLQLDAGDDKVGIGISSPTEKLDVVGNIKSSDSLYVDKIRRATDSGTTTKIKLEANQIQFYAGGNSSVQVCTVSGDRALDVLDATNPQIRLTHSTSPSTYVDLHATEVGDFEVTGSAPNSHMKFICPNGDAAVIIQSNASDGNAELGFSVSAGAALEWSVGVDDGDTDKFKIGNSTIGTSTRMTITTAGYMGVGTTTPHSTFHAGASQAGDYESFTSTTKTLDATNFIVDYKGTSNTDTVVTLPSPSNIAGRMYHILNNSAGGGDVRVETPAGAFLGPYEENDTSDNLTLAGDNTSRQMQSISVISTGSDWFMIHDGRTQGP
jgi:hypothetical protein